MTWQNYQLENTVLKASEDATLWQTERGLVKIHKNTLVLLIRLDGERKGYVFHGHGNLLLDTIVETEEGALGKSVEKEVSKPFLMLGATEEIQSLDTAHKEDFEEAGYQGEQEFLAEAEKLFNHFLGRGRGCHCECFDDDQGLIFAFSNETNNPDILVTKGSKLVYKATGIVFVSSKGNSILKRHDAVVLSNNGKSFVIEK